MIEKENTRNDYLERINIVRDYISNHLSEEIDLKSLANLANFSPFHFHRIAKALLGESIGSYVGRLRIEAAARLLRYTNEDITDIAYTVGYQTRNSFSRSFTKCFGITPSDYRKKKNNFIAPPTKREFPIQLEEPRIVKIAPKNLIYLHLSGNYEEVDYAAAWQQLWDFVEEEKIEKTAIEQLAFFHDDPHITDLKKLRTDVCLSVPHPVAAKRAIGFKHFQGGKYAVFTHLGLSKLLEKEYDGIYLDWFIRSGEQLGDTLCFEKCYNTPTNTSQEKLKTEIYISIK
ncbi:MAG: AraC family transcriptional regulator [Bacteroidaceae bacterium]|nr:AraC family transcriptional regulator [Bacteroidaceae bacterium]